ncbi:hypothetical protein GCM10011594_27290 [Nakamurella endophytica]|uniref:Uncharacterized protein n=1 Tax=Nakamurella endophytica TaxID=1748367 RepID=A0A917WI27_9ACTN|nr:hypothetical protein GCM10011594_27290 [Nakamurella endophytica]
MVAATGGRAYFLLDDATGVSDLPVVDARGALLGRVRVAGLSARNGEALAGGSCGPAAGRCLFVGDIGDNAERRDDIVVHRLREPSVRPVPSAPVPADDLHFRYPDGPHNAEALVVAADGSVVVITKPGARPGQDPAHRIYRGPAAGGDLALVRTFVPPRPASPLQSLLTGTVVTDASWSRGRLLLLTYDEVVEYRAPSPTADPASFPDWPHRELVDPGLPQQEGITATDRGPADCGYLAVSEEGPGGSRGSMVTVDCAAP